MKGYIKKHLRELIWFSFLNQTDVFLSHELFEFLYICYRKAKYRLNENNLKLMLRKTVFDSIYKDNEGELKWISENNKDYRVLIKNDLIFLRDRSKNIMRKWFLVSYKQFLKITCEFEYEDEDIYLFDMIMEIDEEYKKMLMYCHNKGLSLEDEVYSILNVKNDNYIEDIENIKNEEYMDDEINIKNEEINNYYDYDSELKMDEDTLLGYPEDTEINKSSFVSLKSDNLFTSNFNFDTVTSNSNLTNLVNKSGNVLKNEHVLKTNYTNDINTNTDSNKLLSSIKPNSFTNFKTNILANSKPNNNPIESIYNTISSNNSNLYIKPNGYYIDSKFIPLNDDDDNISSKAVEILNNPVDISLTPAVSLTPENEESLSKDETSLLTEESSSKDEEYLDKDNSSLTDSDIELDTENN